MRAVFGGLTGISLALRRRHNSRPPSVATGRGGKILGPVSRAANEHCQKRSGSPGKDRESLFHCADRCVDCRLQRLKLLLANSRPPRLHSTLHVLWASNVIFSALVEPGTDLDQKDLIDCNRGTKSSLYSCARIVVQGTVLLARILDAASAPNRQHQPVRIKRHTKLVSTKRDFAQEVLRCAIE
jgi:hypothetical protein